MTLNRGNDNTDIAKAIAVDSSVNIYVATQVNSDIAVFKYDADGVLDAAWGDMGSTTPYDSGGTDDVFSIALDGDGNVYVAGSQGTDIVVLKFGADGVLDGDWGIAGVFVYDSGEGNDVATEIITDSDGSVYVAGYQATATTGIDAVVLKLDDAGEFDATWGIAGIVSYNSNGTQTDQALDIVLDGGGNVYTVGYQATNGNDWLIQKYLSTGALDTDFGTSGIVTYNSGALQADVANTVAIDSNGFVVVGGYHTTNGRDVAIRRYTSWGALDVSFGNTSITDFPQNYVLGSLATLDEDATSIDSVSIYADAAIGTTTFAIYDDSFNLLWESDEIIDGTTDDWLTVSIASGTPSTLTDLDAGDYYLAFQIDNTAAVPNFSRGDGYVGFSLEQAYGAFADPLEDYIDTNMLWSVYATYTATPEPEVEEEEEESSGGSSSSHRRSSSSSSSSDTTPAAPASPVAFVASGSVEELMTQLLVLLQQLLEQLIAEQQNQ
jgi:uncharacterized delta-60 repeat protein